MPDALNSTVKTPRTEAQIAAFEKARKTREASLRLKFQAEQAAKTPPPPTVVEETEPVHEDEVAEEREQEEAAIGPDKSSVTVPEDDTIDFDPDAFRTELYGKLDEAHKHISELREHITGLNSKHDELQSSWQQHGVRAANSLNFV
jgi:hypothetical protein